jgi:DNA-binding NarL/FixJ family response regulator
MTTAQLEGIVATTKILIVDDYKQWRLTLRSFLEAMPGFKVVGEAGDALEAVEKTSQLVPDIVLLDIGMPLLSGLEALPRIRRASPNSKIIFVTVEDDSEIRATAVAAGAEGYLLKSQVASGLRPAIYAALNQNQRQEPCFQQVLCPISG